MGVRQSILHSRLLTNLDFKSSERCQKIAIALYKTTNSSLRIHRVRLLVRNIGTNLQISSSIELQAQHRDAVRQVVLEI